MSCNTAFAGLGMKVGADALTNQAMKFGVGSQFDLAGSDANGYPMKSAQTSILSASKSLDKVALASIGQGEDEFTVLQDALISAAVANGGKLMNPYIVDRVLDSNSNVVEQMKPTIFNQSVSEQNAAKLRDMMIRVTHIGGSAPNIAIDGMDVAAKTGTAQEDGHDVPDAWITAFAPAVNSKIAVAVMIQDGENDPTGASAAAPVAKQVLLAGLGG
jgi:peptidoglycan glycosyltransferase